MPPGPAANGLAGLRRAFNRLAHLGSSSHQLDSLALIETLALTAYGDWLASRGGGTRATRVAGLGGDAFERALLRAMIGATVADGTIDADESNRLRTEIEDFDLPRARRDQIVQEFAEGPSAAATVAAAATTPEQAAAVYVAALLAIDPDTAAEHDYLRRLAREMHLDADLVAHLHRTVQGSIRKAP